SLVYLQTRTVAEAVREVLGQALFGQVVAGDGVYLAARRAGRHGCDAALLGTQHGVVQPLLLVTHRPDRDRACHVGVVAAVAGAEVHRDQLTGRELLLRGRAVRHGAADARGDDDVEGGPVGAGEDHRALQLESYLRLGYT